MTFEYRLEKLLKLGEQRQAASSQSLATKTSRLEQFQIQLQELDQRYRECWEQLQRPAGISGAELLLLSEHCEALAGQMEQVRKIIRQLQAEHEAERRRLEQIVKANRSQRRHRDKQLEQWRHQESKRERKQQDDLHRRLPPVEESEE